MGTIVHNIALGSVAAYHNRVANNDPGTATLVVVVLKDGQADADLKDYDTLADLLANAGNTEADFTNYARKVLTDADISPATVDDANDRVEASIGDQTWNSAGGTLDNTTARLLVCYDPSSSGVNDSLIIPLTTDDFVATTNGQDLTALEDPNGYVRAQ